MGIVDKIKEIEAEVARTQKNKATEHHLGLLKAKLARYRAQLLESANKSTGKAGDGFEVIKSGDARISLIGFPSVGKSTLLTKLTTTQSECAAYEFTTLTCIAGVIQYKDARIQLLDTPGIIEGAAHGKGRGRQVIATARTADLIIMMLDAQKGDIQKTVLTRELETMGIRVNKEKPQIYFKPKKGGGIQFNSTVPLTQLDVKTVNGILHEYKIFNAEILCRYDAPVDDLIDVIVGKRVYVKCLYVYNKIDQLCVEDLDRLVSLPDSVAISCEMNLGLDHILEEIWEYLDLLRVYTKKRGGPPDFSDALIMRNNSRIKDFCHMIHRDMARQLKYALVWGTSTKHNPQIVGLQHILQDEDVVQLVKK